MEAICCSKTSVATQQTTRRHIPEDDTFHNHHCENLKSYMPLYVVIDGCAYCSFLCEVHEIGHYVKPSARSQLFEALIKLAKSVRPSAWNNLRTVGRIFMKFDTWNIVESFKFSFTLDTCNEDFTCKLACISAYYLAEYLSERKIFRTGGVEKNETYSILYLIHFLLSLPVFDILKHGWFYEYLFKFTYSWIYEGLVNVTN
jgi:hypothetical protein